MLCGVRQIRIPTRESNANNAYVCLWMWMAEPTTERTKTKNAEREKTLNWSCFYNSPSECAVCALVCVCVYLGVCVSVYLFCKQTAIGRFKASASKVQNTHSPDKRSVHRLSVLVFVFIIMHIPICIYHAHMCICESETYRPPLVAYVIQSFMGVPVPARGSRLRSNKRAAHKYSPYSLSQNIIILGRLS